MTLRATLVIVAALLVAAHFLREGSLAIVTVCILMPLLLLVRRRWSLIVLQLSAYMAAVIWINTAVQLVQDRLLAGRPWGVAVAILGAVTLLTVVAGVMLNSGKLKSRYPD